MPMPAKGFTLIELMIVVAIIAILAGIALPVYQLYIIRARVTEGFVLSNPARLAVREYVDTHNNLPTSSVEANYTSPSATKYVSSVDIGPNAVITITYTQEAGGGTITLIPTFQAGGVLTWSCTGGSLDSRYRPANCRS